MEIAAGSLSLSPRRGRERTTNSKDIEKEIKLQLAVLDNLNKLICSAGKKEKGDF